MRHSYSAQLLGLIWMVFLAAPAAHPAPANFHSAVATASPLLWYSFDEPAGAVINGGSLGASHDGIVSGAVGRQLATLGGDTGISFDTINAYVESGAASPLSGNATFTVEAIVYLSGGASLWGPILHWGDGGGGNYATERWGAEVYFSIQRNNNNRLFAGFYNAGIRTVDTVPTGQWIHVVWVRRGANDSETGSTVYVNGQPVSMERDADLNSGFSPPGYATSSEISVTSSAFRIHRGRDFPAPGDADQTNVRYFGGALDEIAVYGYAMSPGIVSSHYTALIDGTVPPGGYGDSSGAHELVIEVSP